MSTVLPPIFSNLFDEYISSISKTHRVGTGFKSRRTELTSREMMIQYKGILAYIFTVQVPISSPDKLSEIRRQCTKWDPKSKNRMKTWEVHFVRNYFVSQTPLHESYPLQPQEPQQSSRSSLGHSSQGRDLCVHRGTRLPSGAETARLQKGVHLVEDMLSGLAMRASHEE